MSAPSERTKRRRFLEAVRAEEARRADEERAREARELRLADQRQRHVTIALAAVDEALLNSGNSSTRGCNDDTVKLLEEELRRVRRRLEQQQRSSEAEIYRIKGIAEAYKELLKERGALVDIFPSTQTRGHRAQASSADVARRRRARDAERPPPPTPPPPAPLASESEAALSPLWHDEVQVQGRGWVPRAFAPFPEPPWAGRDSPAAACEPTPSASSSSSAASSHALLRFRDFRDVHGDEAAQAKYPDMYEYVCGGDPECCQPAHLVAAPAALGSRPRTPCTPARV